jgi:hypothetical protein
MSGTTPKVPKNRGKSCLKPAKKRKTQTHLEPNAKRMHTAQPTPRWPPRPTRAAQTRRPLEPGPPRSRAHAPLEQSSPRSRVPSFLERGPPCSRSPHEITCFRTRARAFNALTRQSRATTRLGITPRRCSANSLGGAHPATVGNCATRPVSSL